MWREDSDRNERSDAAGRARAGFGNPLEERFWTRFAWCLCSRQKLAAAGEVTSFVAVGHEAEVADAHQTTWEHVQEKASDELVGVQGHRFESIATAQAGGYVITPRLPMLRDGLVSEEAAATRSSG